MEDKREETDLVTNRETELIFQKDNIENSYSKPVKGIIAVFLVVILYTASATCVQLLARGIPDLELNTFRCGIPLVFYSIGLIMMQR